MGNHSVGGRGLLESHRVTVRNAILADRAKDIFPRGLGRPAKGCVNNGRNGTSVLDVD